jgi:hypothetical protein
VTNTDFGSTVVVITPTSAISKGRVLDQLGKALR